MKLVIGAFFILLLAASGASADCPSGTWPGSLYTGPGGGMYPGPGEYCSTRPPLPVFVEILEEMGYEYEANIIRSSPGLPY